MFKIGIVNIEKLETLRELTNEFFMPNEYEMLTISQEDALRYKELGYHVVNADDDLDLEGCKRELFKILSEETGYSPLWGTLTGVRPVKLAGEQIEKLGFQEAHNRLTDYYLISKEKTDLITEMYRFQVETLGKPKDKSIGVYIGIPFCPTRCLYCSFASNTATSEEKDRYLHALCHEIEVLGEKISDFGYNIESIYIGGGTPTELSENQLRRLMGVVRGSFDLSELREYTVEAGRPDTITSEKLHVIKEHGAGRISINPQSMKMKTLELIGRSHTPDDIEAAFEEAMRVGFDSINCDLIAGLPKERIEDIDYSLRKVIDLGADNITIHSLAVKRASRLIGEDPMYHYKQGEITSNMIAHADSVLRDAGFNPYYLYRQKHMAGAGENTGYAYPGKEGLYNVRIMDEHQTLIAFGAGGISKMYYPKINRIERIPNVTNYEHYIDRIDEMIERKEKLFNAY